MDVSTVIYGELDINQHVSIYLRLPPFWHDQVFLYLARAGGNQVKQMPIYLGLAAHRVTRSYTFLITNPNTCNSQTCESIE